jgi:hypothetical protein
VTAAGVKAVQIAEACLLDLRLAEVRRSMRMVEISKREIRCVLLSSSDQVMILRC